MSEKISVGKRRLKVGEGNLGKRKTL